MKYVFIDIRKSDEVYSKRISNSYSGEFEVYNIPMNMIGFNKETIIKHLDWINEIYIVCRSSRRSQFIKDKYFSDIEKIKVNNDLQMENLKHGKNQVELNNQSLEIEVIGSNSFNLYSIMRITQVILGTLILLLSGYTLYQIRNYRKINKIPLMILLFFGFNAFINGLISTCTVAKILEDKLN